ncbi:ATP phosphoribosyltransferase regulatory subunit [Paremcibacter congregatus]|uniref:ATP phosphoribosyltransferase regulatory subunit n=1 Tax=Paremcibacter congregatus TaxID=2043170 RepID=UPI0030ED7637|tara:strand:- start:6380 stop:7537 length:1158 start_codon:yes stop_codon:yes gene_type:complete
MPRSINEPNDTALLPEGLHDTLAHTAEHEAEIVEKLRQCFASHGYERVVPPLVEFEESLLIGPGKAQSRNMFRVMDPVTQRMMAVRTDMTGQVARIARTRLRNAPRPLRLSYSGDVLRVRGTQLRPEREFKQAGVELIGSDSTESYVEIILLARNVLSSVGIANASIDLTMPLLVPAICRGLGLSKEVSATVRHALNAKDMGELETLDGEIGEISRALLAATGAADAGMDILNKINLPTEAREIRGEMDILLARLKEVAPELSMTLDPGEYTGFEFQTGIGFSLFVKGVRGELGRGGRYPVEGDDSPEPATGFSLYLDSLMRALPEMTALKYIYCPYGMDMAAIADLRDQGYRTICGLQEAEDDRAEAQRLKCQYLWQADNVIEC